MEVQTESKPVNCEKCHTKIDREHDKYSVRLTFHRNHDIHTKYSYYCSAHTETLDQWDGQAD
jgi:hypothetical protein